MALVSEARSCIRNGRSLPASVLLLIHASSHFSFRGVRCGIAVPRTDERARLAGEPKPNGEAARGRESKSLQPQTSNRGGMDSVCPSDDVRDRSEDFGGSAARALVRAREGPWLCVPTSQLVCPCRVIVRSATPYLRTCIEANCSCDFSAQSRPFSSSTPTRKILRRVRATCESARREHPIGTTTQSAERIAESTQRLSSAPHRHSLRGLCCVSAQESGCAVPWPPQALPRLRRERADMRAAAAL